MSIELRRDVPHGLVGAPTDSGITTKDDGVAAEPSTSDVARSDALKDMFKTRTKLWTFWGAFGLWTVVMNLSASTTYLYLAFATSYFGSNPKLSTISLLTAILGGVTQPFWGRLADMSRRSASLILALALYVVGYALSAGSKSVEALAAGQVLYSIGELTSVGKS